MKLIAHRGNIYGKSPHENNPFYIQAAFAKGFDVEVDVWWVDGGFFLGHDEPKYSVAKEFFTDFGSGYWCHAKNEDGLKALLDIKANCFWHDTDKYTMTSNQVVWTFPNAQHIPNAIWNQPEWENPSNIYNVTKEQMDMWYGVCSDYVSILQEIYNGTLLLKKN
jgi:hypothetical protein